MDENGFTVLGKNLNPKIADWFVVSINESLQRPLFSKEKTRRVQIKSWECLTKMAHKTYVKESAVSRLRGAGAGDNENE